MTLYCDTETTGLSPHYDTVTLFQYFDPDTMTEARLIQNPDLDQVHEILEQADRIVFHNASFDLAFLKYIPRDINHFDDTLYLSRLKDFREPSHSLDDVTRRTLGYDPYRALDKKKMQRTNWASAQLTPEQTQYARLDVEVLPMIYARLQGLVEDNIYRFDKRSILAGLRIQRRGLPILTDEVNEERNRVRQELARMLALLPFNPNSPKQVTTALGLESSGDRQLAEAASRGDKLAQLTRDARGAAKYLNFLDKLAANPRFYGTLAPAAKSGRFTSKQENIQNLPRDTKRFIGTDPSRVIISADFAQLELRTVAAITADSTMVKLFTDNLDLHGYTAEQLFGAGYTKEQRNIAKVFNFSTLYGAGYNTIALMMLTQAGVKLSIPEVKKLHQRWLKAYRGIEKWQQQGKTRHDMGLSYRTPHGRPYTSKMATDMLNIENQGAGAEVARLALHFIEDNLPPEAKLINFIHDSYIVEAPNDPKVYERAARVIQEGMQHAWRRAPFDKRGIPMPVDVGVAYNLKDADSLEGCIYVLAD